MKSQNNNRFSQDNDSEIMKMREMEEKEQKSENRKITELDDYIYEDVKIQESKKEELNRKSKRKKRLKKALIITASTIGGLILIAALIFTALYLIGKSSLLGNTDDNIVIDDSSVVIEDGILIYKGEKYKYNENITSILFMGIDKTFEENEEIKVSGASGDGGRSDFMMLCAVDVETSKATLINIPRDTIARVNIYDKGNFIGDTMLQICLAFNYSDGHEGSGENAIEAVSNLFYNVSINSYFALDMASFPKLTDLIGGMDITSIETIGQFTEGEPVHLDSGNVEKYLRSRRTDIIEGSSLRQQRQLQFVQEYIKIVLDKTKENIGTPLDIYNGMQENIVTNIDVPKITFFITNAISKGFESAGITTLKGENKLVDNYVEFHPDEAEKLDLFIKIYYTKIS